MQIITLSKICFHICTHGCTEKNPGTNPLYSFHKGQKCNKTLSISKNGSL
jgi:hypothetical protein